MWRNKSALGRWRRGAKALIQISQLQKEDERQCLFKCSVASDPIPHSHSHPHPRRRCCLSSVRHNESGRGIGVCKNDVGDVSQKIHGEESQKRYYSISHARAEKSL